MADDSNAESESPKATAAEEPAETSPPTTHRKSNESQMKEKKKVQTSSIPTSSRSRANKLYRTPPTPEPIELLRKEKTFTLDSRAVSNISCNYSRANPKLGSVIPPYNSQRDVGCKPYFQIKEVQNVLRKTGQDPPGTSIDGRVMDYFFEVGDGARYITRRNIHGSGQSESEIYGHGHFMEHSKPHVGWRGNFGYRRNTPNLRSVPSPFGLINGRTSLY